MTDDELLEILDVPFKFWSCRNCRDTSHQITHTVTWTGDLATCDTCGATNGAAPWRATLPELIPRPQVIGVKFLEPWQELLKETKRIIEFLEVDLEINSPHMSPETKLACVRGMLLELGGFDAGVN